MDGIVIKWIIVNDKIGDRIVGLAHSVTDKTIERVLPPFFFFFLFLSVTFLFTWVSVCVCLFSIYFSLSLPLSFCLFLAELWVCYHHTSSTHTHTQEKKNLILWTQVRHKLIYFSSFLCFLHSFIFYLFLFVSLCFST
jgi:hypothetical protein